MPLNLTWVTFSATEGLVHPGQVKRHSLPFQVEAVLEYLVVPLTFALDCTYVPIQAKTWVTEHGVSRLTAEAAGMGNVHSSLAEPTPGHLGPSEPI